MTRMFDALLVLLQALNPVPWGEPQWGIAAAFSLGILTLAVAALPSELRLAWRGLRLGRLVATLSRNSATLRHHDEVEDVAQAIEDAAPELKAGSRRLADTAHERFGKVLGSLPGRELFDAAELRRRCRGRLLPQALLETAPALLVGMGVLGTVLGVAAALTAAPEADATQVFFAGLRTSLRTTTWGVLSGLGLAMVGRWARGQAEASVDALVVYVDRAIERGTQQNLLAELVLVQEQARDTAVATRESVSQVARLLASSRTGALDEQTVEALGNRMEEAFAFAVEGKLGPMLERIVALTQQATAEARGLINQSATAHVEGVGRIVDKVVARIDLAVGANLRAASEQMTDVARSQAQTLISWRDNVGNVAALVAQLDRFTRDLTESTERIGAATAPVIEASRRMEATATGLNRILPALESTAVHYQRSSALMDTAATSLKEGTTSYVEAVGTVRSMIVELGEAHAGALDRFGQSVNIALRSTIEEAGRQLRALSEAQVGHLDAWDQALQSLRPALTELRTTTTDLQDLATRFKDAATPTAQAGEAFQRAAQLVSTLFPRIETAAQGYDRFNAAMTDAARQLAASAAAYNEAGTSITQVIEGAQTSLELQRAGNAEFTATLEQANRFLVALPAASEGMQRAATELHAATGETAALVQRIRGSVEVQDQAVQRLTTTAEHLVTSLAEQEGQWQHLRDEMTTLRDALDLGVTAFSQRLPRTIDDTLVQFDAALAEGVERLGSAVERLREAMDDLHERLEMVLDGRRGR